MHLPAPGFMPAAMSYSRESQLDWLDQVLKKTGLTLNALAEMARVNPATLYRFHSGASDHMRAVTINRIAKVAQVEPPAFSGLSAGDARDYDIKTLPETALPGPGEPQLAAVKVTHDAMRLSEIAAGDILIIDRARAPAAGDIVVAQLYDFRLGTAETIVRIYEPPYLVASTDNAEHRRPLLVDNDRVQITGVVARQIRVREFPKVA